MGRPKNSGNKLAAQIAADEAEEENFTLPPNSGGEGKRPAKAQEKAAVETKAKPAAKEPEKAAPEAPAMYTAEQVAEMMKEAAAAAVAEAMKNLPQQQQPQVVQVMADTEKVVLRWMAPVADDNVAVFCPNGMSGQATGKSGTVIVPKSEWSRFYDETMRRFIDRRWLVVLSGMTDEERMLYHCDYRKGEVMDERGFANIFRMGEELLPYFDALCTEHQEMVARSFCEAAEKGHLDDEWRPLVKKLNAMNKKRYKDAPENDIRRKGMFRPVLDALNSAEDEE